MLKNLSNSPTNGNNNSVNYGSNNEMKRSSNSNDLRIKAPNYLRESGSKMGKIINEIEQVKDTVRDKIELVIERGEDMALLEKKTNHLADDSIIFRNCSRSLRHKYCRQSYKQKIVMIFMQLLSHFI